MHIKQSKHQNLHDFIIHYYFWNWQITTDYDLFFYEWSRNCSKLDHDAALYRITEIKIFADHVIN